MKYHLGNILSVISDKKIGHTSNGTTLDYYNADVISATDYYPFGMISRSVFTSGLGLNYRYGFNGKENDDDVKGAGDQIDYGMRIYDPRLGRFLSVDPLTPKYPSWSPYAFAMNSPISGVDLDGLEYYYSSGGTLVGHVTEDANGKKLNEKTSNSVKQATNTTQSGYTNGAINLSFSHADF